LLADADEPVMRSLRAWSAPLGVAFQLRDDLLSTFGTSQETGKPGDDLRHGKHNAVVAAFRKARPSEAAAAAVDAVWGRGNATDDEVAAATAALAGARADVEARLSLLSAEATNALTSAPFDREAKQMLEEVTRRLTDRGS
jgi:geranylgeranyl diphosphate synthase type I